MKSKRKIAILLGLVVLLEILFLFLMKKIEMNSPGFEIFDMKLFYSITSFHSNQNLLQEESTTTLILFKGLDMLFPLIYGLLLYTWLKYVKVTNRILLAIPWIGMVGDYIENIVLTIKTYVTNQLDFLIYITNAVTTVKFACILLSVILIVYFGITGRGKNDDIKNKTFTT